MAYPVRASRRGVVLVLLAVLCLAPVQASTLLPADFRVVVTDATVIVRGRVTDVRAVRSVAGDVETVATIAVEAVLKGEAATFVSMRVPGGTMGRYRTVMPGAPRVGVGDAGVFLLKRVAGGSLWPVGMSAGIYRVTVSNGRTLVAPPVAPGITAAATGVVTRGDTRRGRLPLSEFESIVRLIVRGAALPSRNNSGSATGGVIR
jgi:hypothetical protein